MAISGVGQGYGNYVYQWQQQQLQGMSSNSSSSSKSSSYNALSTSQTKSQLGSLVELASYAMNAMGVGNNDRVTFGQIQKYKSELEKEYSEAIKKGLADIGVDTSKSFQMTMSKDGKLSVTGDHPDKAEIQKYLDSHPDFGKDIQAGLGDLGLSDSTTFQLTMDSTGSIQVEDTTPNKAQTYLNEHKELGANTWKALKELGIDTSKGFQLSMGEDGKLTVSSDHPDKDKIQQYLDEHPELGEKLATDLGAQDLETSGMEFTMTNEGALSINSSNADIDKIQKYFRSHPSLGSDIMKGLEDTKVSPDIKFQLTTDKDGKLVVVSSDPDKDKVQKFFDDNPKLAAKYEQIQALANLDSARKAMQVSPAALRNRIQIESMASWWDSSGSSTASIGDFSGGNLAFYSGLNTRV